MNEEKKALEALDKLYDENGDALQQLAAIERKELLEKMNLQTIQEQNWKQRRKKTSNWLLMLV
jgi:hypothetical protein